MRVERALYTLAVIRAGSFRRAATELGISQPTLSAQITALEEDLDTVLLVRGRHGATATPAALTLVPRLRSMIEAEGALRAEAMAISGSFEGTVRIASTSLGAELLVAPTISAVVANHPTLQFRVLEEVAPLVVRGVQEGTFDFGVATMTPDIAANHLRWTPLTQLALGCFVPVGHPLAGEALLTWRQIGAFPLVSVRKGSALWSIMAAHVDEPNVVAQAGNLRAVHVMAHHGAGLGIGPEPSSAEHELSGCSWTRIADADSLLRLQLCQRTMPPISRSAQALRDAIIGAAQSR